MDVYGVSAPTDVFPIDDLLDFSNDEIFSISNCSSTATTTAESHYNNHHHQPHSDNSSAASGSYYDGLNCSNAFTDYLSVPSDDVAELEWLSNFVEDSFTNFPANSITGTMNLSSNTTSSFHKSRSKRSRSTSNWTTSSLQNPNTTTAIMKNKERSGITRERSCAMEDVPRRCTHCASETTPQWRTGPLGPKTLCNACGVRYKSGRLVPEYRPAASPTFVLTQHSNSHRKVIELRRQKEMNQQHPLPEEGMYGRRFRDC